MLSCFEKANEGPRRTFSLFEAKVTQTMEKSHFVALITSFNPMTVAAIINRMVYHSVILELDITSYRLKPSRENRET
jgi:hypothetical protein